MSSNNFENMVKTGLLKSEPWSETEYQGLIKSGQARLHDATNDALSDESRFDLAYNAAHAFSLAALRKKGFRPANRYIVFQALPFTLGLGAEVWRVLAKCHEKRNTAEYEGDLEIEQRLLADLICATKSLFKHLS